MQRADRMDIHQVSRRPFTVLLEFLVTHRPSLDEEQAYFVEDEGAPSSAVEWCDSWCHSSAQMWSAS